MENDKEAQAHAEQPNEATVALICVLAALLGPPIGIWSLWTMPTVPPKLHRFEEYQDQLATLEKMQEAYDAVEKTRPQLQYWYESEKFDEAHPELTAYWNEIKKLKAALPKEPPDGYAVFLLKYGSLAERTKSRELQRDLGIGGIAAGPIGALLAYALFLGSRSRLKDQEGDSSAKAGTSRWWHGQREKQPEGSRARVYAARQADEAAVREMEEESRKLSDKK